MFFHANQIAMTAMDNRMYNPYLVCFTLSCDNNYFNNIVFSLIGLVQNRIHSFFHHAHFWKTQMFFHFKNSKKINIPHNQRYLFFETEIHMLCWRIIMFTEYLHEIVIASMHYRRTFVLLCKTVEPLLSLLRHSLINLMHLYMQWNTTKL